MSESNNHPEQNPDDQLGEFELRLRERTLGSSPERRDELMYHCGYAAGVAETRMQSHRMTMRWRAVGLAASLLACVSLLAHFMPSDENSDNQLGMKTPLIPLPAESEMAASDTDLFALLTRERQSTQQSTRILRASATALTNVNTERIDAEIKPIVTDDQSTPLRPGDFTLFL